MKLIITESQLRLIVENEGENLMDLTDVYEGGLPPDKLDDYFLFVNEKKGGKYDGYYIDGLVNIRNSPIKQFKHLVRIKGHLYGTSSEIEDLGKLKKVDGHLSLSKTKNLKSLGNLEKVGFSLDISNSNIEDLGHLNEVGWHLDLRFTEKLKSLGEVSPSFVNDKFKIYVTDDLFIYNTGLSDEDINKIKVWGKVRKNMVG